MKSIAKVPKLCLCTRLVAFQYSIKTVVMHKNDERTDNSSSEVLSANTKIDKIFVHLSVF